MRRRQHTLGWIGLGLVMSMAGAVVPQSASAEDWWWSRGEMTRKHHLQRHHGGFGAELATYAGDSPGGRALLQSPLLGFWYAFSNHFMLSVDWGMAYYRDDASGQVDRTFRFGNPMVAGYYVGHHGNLKLRLGAALTAPVATLPDGGDSLALAARAYGVAAASRGGWNLWLWAPEAATLAFPARFEMVALPKLLLAADVTMAIPIYLHGQGAGFVMQFAGDLGFRSKVVAVGARLSHVWSIAEMPFLGSFFQMALEPFLRLDFGKPFLHARLTMNLNNPWGFSFDPGGIWGLHLGGGTTF
jgi:hypothetical protein